jgi:putative DNA primase/helicase
MTVPSDRIIARALAGVVVRRNQIIAPGPGHCPRDRSLSVELDASSPDGFRVHSFAGDDWRECRDHVKARLGITRQPRRAHIECPADRPAAVDWRDDDEKRRCIVTSIIGGIAPLRGSPGEAYLRDVRRIDVDAIADVLESSDAIGWHPSVLFREDGHPLGGKRLGCIVAVMTDPVTARPTGGISRTYIHEGQKIGKAKTLGPAGIVRLTPDEDVISGLHLAEGLETALATMAVGLRPIWSTGSTAIMTKFPVLSGIGCLSIIADHDANGAGERAARAVEARWLEAGREVRVLMPNELGDLNDVLKGAF